MSERLLPDVTCALGEGPAWDDREGVLYWVDIKAPALHSLKPVTGDHKMWRWPEVISCCGLSEAGRVIVGGRSGLWVFDPKSGARSLARPIPALAEDCRTNDGKIGPDGAFWISTMQDRDDRAPVGVIMRIAPDGTVQTMLEGFTTANGLEWSPDGRTFYAADTRTLWVDCWDYDPDEIRLSNRRRFVKLEQGKPDGAAVDREGRYWVAGIYSGSVHCYAPDGQLLKSVDIPAEMVTMPCFGGTDMKKMFVTSLSRGSSGLPEDGGLFAVSVDVAGMAPRRMAI